MAQHFNNSESGPDQPILNQADASTKPSARDAMTTVRKRSGGTAVANAA
jgi:hypothetical protein